jgi:hypothetical protein
MTSKHLQKNELKESKSLKIRKYDGEIRSSIVFQNPIRFPQNKQKDETLLQVEKRFLLHS